MKQNLTFTSLKAKWQIKVIAFFVLLFSSTALQAQYTDIPDVVFEQRLISL